MSLNIDSRYITGIYALGQWFNVEPNSVFTDAYEFLNWEEDIQPGVRAEWDTAATAYAMGGYAEFTVPEVFPSHVGSCNPENKKRFCRPSCATGISFIDADTGESVSFLLLEVRAFRERRIREERVPT